MATVGASLGSFDLWYDATTVRDDLVVECSISSGPRAGDPTFDPKPGDHVLVGDNEELPLPSRVLSRQDDRVTVRLQIGRPERQPR